MNVIYFGIFYLLLYLLLLLFNARNTGKDKSRSYFSDAIIHQTNIHHSIFDILLFFIIVGTGIFPWLLFQSSIYLYNSKKGIPIPAICKRKHIKKNKNSYFENPKHIIEIEYHHRGKDYYKKTILTPDLYNFIKEDEEMTILVSNAFPSHWLFWIAE